MRQFIAGDVNVVLSDSRHCGFVRMKCNFSVSEKMRGLQNETPGCAE